MTLHIALDGIDGLGKTTMIKKLDEFLSKKSYNVKSVGCFLIKIYLKSYKICFSRL